MKQEYILQIIQGPLVTEKSSSATAKKQLVFKVARKATKEEIKEAVEAGKISKERYENYLGVLQMIQERREKYL